MTPATPAESPGIDLATWSERERETITRLARAVGMASFFAQEVALLRRLEDVRPPAGGKRLHKALVREQRRRVDNGLKLLLADPTLFPPAKGGGR